MLRFTVHFSTVVTLLISCGPIAFAGSSATSPQSSGDDLFVFANLRLAQRFLEKEEYEQAILRCQTALKADPDNPESMIALASAYRRSGQTERAIELLLPLATRQANPRAIAELGAAYYQLNRFEEAKALFLEAEVSLPDNGELKLLLGSTHLALGELTSAMSCLKEAAESLPEKAKPLIQKVSKQYDESKKAFLRALQAHQEFQGGGPGDPWALYRLTLKLNSEFPPALNNLAWHLATTRDETQRDPQEALQLARKAVELSGGDDPSFLETLAAAQAASGDFEGAIKTTSGILNNPKVPDASKHLELYRKEIPLRE